MSATGTPGDVRGATKRSTTDISAASAHPGGLPLRSGHWHVSVGWPSLIIFLFFYSKRFTSAAAVATVTS